MIDLHTHILPGWDDGAASREEALRMIEIARCDGITDIVLTPHIFHKTQAASDPLYLHLRFRSFLEETQPEGINFFFGAEIRFRHDMIEQIKELDLTLNGSSYVLLEFPSEEVPFVASDFVYRMMINGIIPIISHPERNSVFASSPKVLYSLVRQGALGQINAQSLTGRLGKSARIAAECFLRHRLVHIIASDAHDTDMRPPKLSEGVERAAEIVGMTQAMAMATTVPQAILTNEQIPEPSEPSDPT